MPLRLWAVNWLMPKSCPQGVPWEMKSLGSFYHLQDGVETWQSQATRTSKLIWGRAMASVRFAENMGSLFKKNAKEAFIPKRRARSWTTIKWTASSENAYAQARLRIIRSLSHATILTPLQTFILHIFVQHLFNEEKKTKKTCFLWGGSKLSWNTAHVQKRTCNVELEEFPPSKHTHGFSTQTKK